MTGKVLLVSQARMTSTRLPGKVLREVAGRSLLEWHISRAGRSRVDQVVVATTASESDDPIVECCQGLGVAVTRGSEDDVLSRYQQAVDEHGADVVVRVTSDCPLIDPALIDCCLAAYAEGGFAYVSNTIERSYPRGLDCEVFAAEHLRAAADEAVEQPEREHVTPFIWRRPERFPRWQLVNEEDLSDLRWTVDTPEDLALITRMLEGLVAEGDFGWRDALALYRAQPEWHGLNQHIRQKPVF